MTAAMQATRIARPRPSTLRAAVALSVVSALAPILLLPLMSGVDGFVVGVTIGFTILFLAGAWGLWSLSRWAGIGLFVVNALNGLLSFGGIFTAPDGSPDALDRVLGVIGVCIAVCICGLLVARPSRQALQ